MAISEEPVSRLDERIDEFLRALASIPRLERVVAGMRQHEQVAERLGPDFPGVVDVLAGADLRRAFIRVAEEVIALQGRES